MLPWWGWVLLWALLLAGSAALLGWRLRRLWRRSRVVLAELERAEDVLGRLEATGRDAS
ncbi:MAG TPA: hypothetical protein VES95_04855 [Dermatophilaceae bacterium]|nr:hypothetical protein [Dermatophilaceae bacterium]